MFSEKLNMNTARFRQIAQKLYLSLLLLTLTIAAGFLVIGIPIVAYDHWIIEKNQQCVHTSLPKNFSAQLETDRGPWDKYRKAADSYETNQDLAVQPSTTILFDNYGWVTGPPGLIEFIRIKCGVRSLKFEKGKFISFTNKVIIDNDPTYSAPLAGAFLFFVIVLLLFLTRKWLLWVFKP